jgi:shikimate dehydrogenase
MTTSFCVVGSPIEHSLSPLLHAAAYAHLGLSFEYTKSEVSSGELASFLESRSLSGVSVTMPLKREAFDLAVRHDQNAIATGVANTLFQSEGEWSAANTDVYGIRQALAMVEAPKRTVVLGSGATASSALVALSGMFPDTEISIVSRNQETAMDLIGFSESLGFSAQIQPVETGAVLAGDLVLSLVPAGSFETLWSQIALESNASKGVLFDVAYNPWPSSAASSWDASRVVSGIEMLIWQAIEQVQLFVTAVGVETVIDRDSLYKVMKAEVSAK